jgi:hypothetical protein
MECVPTWVRSAAVAVGGVRLELRFDRCFPARSQNDRGCRRCIKSPASFVLSAFCDVVISSTRDGKQRDHADSSSAPARGHRGDFSCAGGRAPRLSARRHDRARQDARRLVRRGGDARARGAGRLPEGRHSAVAAHDRSCWPAGKGGHDHKLRTDEVADVRAASEQAAIGPGQKQRASEARPAEEDLADRRVRREPSASKSIRAAEPRLRAARRRGGVLDLYECDRRANAA